MTDKKVDQELNTLSPASPPTRRNILLAGTAVATAALSTSALVSTAQAQQSPQPPTSAPSSGRKPNILVVFGDDIGQTNLSAYSFGVMGYYTPNIDRIANEGMKFTDYYAEQSCTAGRSTFITGQCTLRTGLSKVGIPGATVGLQARDATIAELLKPMGYATGQFGKNHLGDRDEFLPTNHGFDEFFGNLYHLNAEEEPEARTYPTDPAYRKKFGPRGVIKSSADGKIEDSGPLSRKRMETIDDETSAAAIDFMQRQAKANRPFFCWYNSTRMHFRTHVRDGHRSPPGIAARTEYADGMVEHDAVIGTILKAVDDMGITNDTIVIYTTDNGPHQNSWPDAGTTPFRSEKNTNWEGAFRVPCLIRWPGRIKAGSISNEIVSGLDWMPTLMAAAGEPDIKEKLLKGHQAGSKTFKVHLDGYNQLPYLTGQQPKGARDRFIYFNDDGDIVAARYQNWKIVFEEQRATGTMRIWAEPFTKLRLPKFFDLRSDPYERADITSNTYYDWQLENTGILYGMLAGVGEFLQTFKDFPPSQTPQSFSIDQMVDKLQRSLAAGQQ
ncbi:arylsulfatase [Bradyrhizobium liaoningense]|uniref:arylsulfatase n=1 Tax=Bradyrhizobium liaoningense TaxID=43992 RepID=UPI001BABD59C|nr:arylsulfatase [Bradyrhizobium liaoningense]MBR0822701.1 arylsulfatase [Bradyrhizobium liaoningense]